MTDALRRNLRNISPYTAGEQPKIRDGEIIKLNTNENPYPPAPEVMAAFKAVDPAAFGLYPDPESREFVSAAARFYGLAENQVFVGNGSDDVLALVFQAFFNSGRPIVFPDITYSFYKVWAGLFGIPYKTIPLDADFRINPADYALPNGGVVIANPNAPTGVALPLAGIRAILDANPDVIAVVDEAYIDFGGESAVGLINRYENLIVVHTFSKYRSLAGARLALALGDKELIARLNAVKNSYNSYPLSRASQIIAAAALAPEADAYSKANAAKIAAARDKFAVELSALGFFVPPSAANFVFASHESAAAKDIFTYLRKLNIFVRHFDAPRIDNFLRITIGREEQMRKVTDALEDYLRGGNHGR